MTTGKGKWSTYDAVDSAKSIDSATIIDIILTVIPKLREGPTSDQYARPVNPCDRCIDDLPMPQTHTLLAIAVGNYNTFMLSQKTLNYLRQARYDPNEQQVETQCLSMIQRMFTAGMVYILQVYPHLQDDKSLYIVKELTSELHSMFVQRNILFKETARERQLCSFTPVA